MSEKSTRVDPSGTPLPVGTPPIGDKTAPRLKIFLSSTSYDLQDLRDLTVAHLHDMGHDPIFFESPTFPVHLHLHSHDQCIVSIDGCDLLICVVDRRYGGKYSGALKERFSPQRVSIRGKKKAKEINVEDLSATWCEVLEAHRLGIPVMTFARERVMNEKETRRKNVHIKRFQTAFVDSELVFDFLDWTTQQKLNNWITQFRTVVDFVEKLEKWVESYALTRVPVSPTAMRALVLGSTKPGPRVVPHPVNELVVFCEGATDAAVLRDIVARLSLPASVTVLPAYGKGAALANLNTVVPGLLKQDKGVLFVLDSDTWDADESEAQIRQFGERVRQSTGSSAGKSVELVLATMAMEMWVLAGLDGDGYEMARKRRASFRDLKRAVQQAGVDLQQGLPATWDLDRAKGVDGNLSYFVQLVEILTGRIRMA